jgi:protein-S-isoprenylcysteine O-methyltransferase Ste14
VQRWPTVVALVPFVACFGTFMVAARRFFTRALGERLDVRARLILVLSAVFGTVHGTLLIQRRPPASGAVVGAAIYGGALLLFLRCVELNRDHPLPVAYGTRAPHRLVREGPYRYVRHPIYLSYVLAWSAGPVATGRAGMAVCAALMGLIYYRTARSEETRLLLSPWGEDYGHYQRAVGMFLPRLRRSQREP